VHAYGGGPESVGAGGFQHSVSTCSSIGAVSSPCLIVTLCLICTCCSLRPAPIQVQSRAAYLLFYRRRAAAAQDPPDLVPQLLEARQQLLQDKAAAAEQEAAAAAAAVAGEDGLAAMDADGPDTVDTPAAAAGDGSLVDNACYAIVPVGSPPLQDGCASPDIRTAAAAGGGAGGGIGGALLGIASPAPAARSQAFGGGRSGGGAGRRMGAVEDSSDTSTSLRNTGGLEEGDSSDGSSSSRPRGRGGVVQSQREAAEAQAAAEAVDSWGPLQGGSVQRPGRPSDQDVGDIDMDDRDV
jgi:hypothetical protein